MADVLPTRDRSDGDDGDGETAPPRVVDLDSEAADELLDALSSDTARSVLSALYDDPATPSEVADRIDTSLQNAQYHLDNLQEAGAIEVVDTAYSQKGREMRVYGPAEGSLVLYASRDEDEPGRLRRALRRLVGGLLGIGLASLAVQALLGGSSGGGGGVGTADVTTTAADPGPLAGLPPGALFFAGGVTVLLAWVAVGYRRG